MGDVLFYFGVALLAGLGALTAGVLGMIAGVFVLGENRPAWLTILTGLGAIIVLAAAFAGMGGGLDYDSLRR